MTKYIDAELRIQDIQEEYCKPCKKRGDDYNGVVCRACWVGDCINIIIDSPEANVQPIVNCKDCISRRLCSKRPQGCGTPKNCTYCSLGEKGMYI